MTRPRRQQRPRLTQVHLTRVDEHQQQQECERVQALLETVIPMIETESKYACRI